MRHQPTHELIQQINAKLQGHYGYYGITFNSRSINSYYYQTRRMLQKWLQRRGGRRKWNWEQYGRLVDELNPLRKPRIVHSYK
ncbi:MAG: hypothetical protein LAT67_12920 [Balneolales bacterium]|nr:hypothetical protein [Balneolales bacterium]